MYPDAKFIHIYRNPYIVYLSTKTLYKKAVSIFYLQKLSEEEEERLIFSIYKEMMRDYFAQVALIPKENFVEVRFEDLEKDPMAEMRKVYNAIDLSGFEAAAPNIQAYLNSLGTYKKNKYNLDKTTIQKIESHWKFTIDRWGYEVPE